MSIATEGRNTIAIVRGVIRLTTGPGPIIVALIVFLMSTAMLTWANETDGAREHDAETVVIYTDQYLVT